MKIRMSRMFIDGVETPKREFFGRYDYKNRGTLTVTDTTQQGLDRLTKVATFKSTLDLGPDVLFEPHLVWANDGRFVDMGGTKILSFNFVMLILAGVAVVFRKRFKGLFFKSYHF